MLACDPYALPCDMDHKGKGRFKRAGGRIAVCGEARLLGRKADIEKYLASKPGGDLRADYMNIRGTMANGKRGVGGWNWTRNKKFIFDALEYDLELRLVTNPDAPLRAGGNTYQRELKFLADKGCSWHRVSDYWRVFKARTA